MNFPMVGVLDHKEEHMHNANHLSKVYIKISVLKILLK